MKNKYTRISALSQELKSVEMDLCWEMRGYNGNPRAVAKVRREVIRKLASVK